MSFFGDVCQALSGYTEDQNKFCLVEEARKQLKSDVLRVVIDVLGEVKLRVRKTTWGIGQLSGNGRDRQVAVHGKKGKVEI